MAAMNTLQSLTSPRQVFLVFPRRPTPIPALVWVLTATFSQSAISNYPCRACLASSAKQLLFKVIRMNSDGAFAVQDPSQTDMWKPVIHSFEKYGS